MPLLANAYALDFAFKHLTRAALTTSRDDFRQVETNRRGAEGVLHLEHDAHLQTGREACGGEGYLAINRFAALKADSDIFTTFEGDNTVLMQLVAKNLLTDFAATVQGPGKGRSRWALGQKLRRLARCAPRFPRQCPRRRPARGGDADRAFPPARGSAPARRGARIRALTTGRPQHAVRRVHRPAKRPPRPRARARRAPVVLERFNAGIVRLPGCGSAPDPAASCAIKLSRSITIWKKAARGSWKTDCYHLPVRAESGRERWTMLCAEVRRDAVASSMRSASRRNASPHPLPWIENPVSICRILP